MNKFKTFIASSLKEQEFLGMREELANTLHSLNGDPALAPLNFDTYRFECEGSNVACSSGSQNEINLKIEECQAFVLICDSNIGSKTREEFRKAQERFKKFLNPTFIMVLKKKGNTPCGENQKTYEEFKKEDLTIFKYKKDGSVEDDYFVYEFEFDSIETAAEKLKEDLKKWITTNNHRPLFKAELGADVSPSFLYDKDENRKDKCDEKMYFRRCFDDILDQALVANEQIILIKGASLSGKTRALYQAIKNLPDAWFYKFGERHDEGRLIEEINEIADYIIPSRCDSPLYLIFDDVHQMPSNNSVKSALERLLNAIKGKNIHVITTSTSSSDDDFLFKPNKVIKIKSLTKKEYNEATLFFRRFGLTVEDGYKEIGAMMVDIKGIRDVYNSFKSNVSELDEKLARECLLYVIKASSIWHNLNIGNVEKLFNFSKFMLVNECNIDEKKAKSLLYKSFKYLLSAEAHMPGISCDEKDLGFEVSRIMTLPKYINIEEYIYRYVLDENTFKDELDKMNSILEYVCAEKLEDIIVSLSKISRRAENREEIAQRIYSLVMAIYKGEESSITDADIDWAKGSKWCERLKKEIDEVKNEVRDSCGKSNEECSELCIYMAKIIWSRMLYTDSYDEAEAIFNDVPPQLQSLPMLGVLIVKSSGRQERLRDIIEKKGVEKSYYIINKLIPFATDFNEARSFFEKGELPYENDADYVYSSSKLREFKENRQYDGPEWDIVKTKDINRQNFVSALNNIAVMVRCPDDLEKLLEVVRDNYVWLLDDLESAEKFVKETECYSREKLTMIDLVSRLDFYTVRAVFINILTWGSNVPAELCNLTDRIIQEFVNTSKLYTPGYKSKHTVSTIFNAFIEKCSNSPYNDVFNEIFIKMNVPVGDKMINLRDSFTYSGMMRVKECKFIDAMDLYYNFMEPHSKDSDSHLIITRFMLNEILKKVHSASMYKKISGLFEDNDVTKDVYTYNLAMANLDYEACVQLLPQMCKDNIEIDIYTLGTLISKAPNVKVAAAYFDTLFREGIATESKMFGDSDVKKKLEAKIKDYTEESSLEHQHYFWATLMETRCRDEEDRKTLFRILEYMERRENRSRIFNKNDNGTIYNNCIKNRSFIRCYDEAVDFISSKNIIPDKYTLTHLVTIIVNDYKKNPDDCAKKMTERLNNLYCENEEMIVKELKQNNTHIYNKRFRAYRSHADRLSFVFLFPDGKKKMVESLTSMEYLKYLIENSLPIDQDTISSFVGIAQGQTFDLLKELIALVNEKGLFVNGVDTIVKKFEAVIPEKERVSWLIKIFELPVRGSVVSSSRVAVKMYSYGLCTLEEAFSRIDGNRTEKLYLYTQLITQFRKFESKLGKDRIDNSEDFEYCMGLYNEYVVKQGITPNADILSNLANFANCREELERVFNEHEKYNIAPISYIITPILRVSENFKGVEELLKRYIQLGGAEPGRLGSENEVDIILCGLNIIWRDNKNADEHRLISKLTDYILSTASSCEILGSFPFFEIYKREGDCLTQKGLRELLYCWPCCDDPNEINVKYIERLKLLLEKYYKPDNDEIRPKLVEAMAYVCKERKLNLSEIFNVLKPYPKLAFMLASKLRIYRYNTYKLLVEIWCGGFDRIPQDDAINILFTILETITSPVGGIILDAIYSKWETGLSVADFLISKDKLPSAPELTKYKENDELRRKYLNYLKYRFQAILEKGQYGEKMAISMFVNNIFIDRVDYDIFNELSSVIEGKRGYSGITTQRLLHELLLVRNRDFVLGEPKLLLLVAKTLVSVDEYRFFTEDLMTFDLTVSPELAATLMDAIMKIHDKNPNNKLVSKVAARLIALAGYDLCFPGENCHAFKAGYFLLRWEHNILFDHRWAGEPLHLTGEGTEEIVKRIENAGFFERVNAIMAIDSIMLRCEVLFRFYVENEGLSRYENYKIMEKISICFGELANAFNGPDAGGIRISSVISLFALMTKRNIKVPNCINQSMLLGLVNFYRRQSENELLGNYYKKNVAYVLNKIRSLCENNRRLGNRSTKIYYYLFANNRVQGESYLVCDTETLYNALS